MMNFSVIFRSPPAEFENHLAEREPYRPPLVRMGYVVAGLVLLCLVLRGAMASKTNVLCPDAVLYIRLAQGLDEGNLGAGYQAVRPNTFPMVLMVLHRMGLEWEMAGKLWGVIISSLVVLPLFGWVRRMFDDRVALVACLLYAINANLIRWSHEVIRDPTFWFLFTLSIYLLWRAITEVRPWLFALGGSAVMLAILTRFEGVFLLIPVALWAFWRLRSLEVARRRLVVGLLAGVAAGITTMVVMNLIWLSGHPGWKFAELSPLGRIPNCARATLQTSPSKVVETTARSTSTGATRMSTGAMVISLHRWIGRGLTPVYTLLLLVGLWRWRRMLLRRDVVPMVLVSLAVIGGMWIHLCHAQTSSLRYALPIALMGAGIAALGLWAISNRVWQWSQAWQWSERRRVVASLIPLFLVVAIGTVDALRRDYSDRESWARLGRWARDEYGPRPTLIGPQGTAATANYYAQGRCLPVPNDVDDQRFAELAEKYQPDVVLFHASQIDHDRLRVLRDRARTLGLELVNPCDLPQQTDGLVVFARPNGRRSAAREVREARNRSKRHRESGGDRTGASYRHRNAKTLTWSLNHSDGKPHFPSG